MEIGDIFLLESERSGRDTLRCNAIDVSLYFSERVRRERHSQVLILEIGNIYYVRPHFRGAGIRNVGGVKCHLFLQQ